MRRLFLLFACLALLPTVAWGQSAQIETARAYLQEHADRHHIEGEALSEAVVTDAYTSKKSGVTHVYFQQHRGGIPVADARITVNVGRDGRVLLAGGTFAPGIEAASRTATPSLSAEAAVATAVRHLGLALTEPLTVEARADGPARAVTFSDGGASRAPIPASLIYHPTEDKSARLAWDVEIEELEHVWTVRVDAATSEILWQWDQVVHDHWGMPASAAIDLTAPDMFEAGPLATATSAPTPRSGDGGSYRVFDEPVESPNFGERTLVADPADPVASPNGWHDTGSTQYTKTRGNNTWAYIDASGGGGPNGTDAEPDGGEDLVFDFPIDFAQQPSTYRPAAVTNLFYWNNIIHDVLYHYGFDEVSGNFQETNFTGEGLGNDALRAEGQDGSDTNNARYFRSPDGGISRIEMYLWTTANPRRDGDFDNGIIVHEVGHGVSIRITGGPNTDQCLSNSEQMGEGWSDWYGLMMTIQEGDVGETGRGIGTYALNQPPTGPGIRPTRYSTDLGINPTTYGDIGGLAVPHGVGYAWATVIWEMTWNLIDVYGFDPDLIGGTGGNNLALELVTEALKLQPCAPGFVTGRDAILAADEALYDGENAPYIWEAFAKRGVGFSASQGGTGSGDEVEAFDLPPGLGRFVLLEATPDPVNNFEFIDYTLTFSNGTARDPVSDVVLSTPIPADAIYVGGSASDGGTFEDGVVTFPSFDADTGTETVRTFRLLANADAATMVFFTDDMEDGTDNWTTTHGAGSVDWVLDTDGGNGGTAGWFGNDVNTVSDQYLTLAEPLMLTTDTELRFIHRYATESNWDGGVVEISTNGGSTWTDLGPDMTQNGYNGTLNNSSNPIGGRPAFMGSSGGFIETVVDLSGYTGEEVLVRFRMGCDSSVSSDGWYVDDVSVSTAPAAVNIEACAPGTDTDCAESRVLVLEAIEPAPVASVSTDELQLELDNGGMGTLQFTISNDGERALDWQIGSQENRTSPWLDVEPSAGTIEVDATETITVTFDASGLADETVTDLLGVYTNDPEALVNDLAVTLVVGTGVDAEGDALPGEYALSELYPNPFSDRAEFTLEVAEAQTVRVAVYDVMGREVARLHDGPVLAGTPHGFVIDGASLASGVYLVRVAGERFAETRRVTLLN